MKSVEFWFCWIFLLHISTWVLFFIFGIRWLIFFFLFSYLKSMALFFCAINNNFLHQYPIKCYFFCVCFYLVANRKCLVKRYSEILTWFSDKACGGLWWFFFSSFIIIIIVFFENHAKISDNPFWIICDL